MLLRTLCYCKAMQRLWMGLLQHSGSILGYIWIWIWSLYELGHLFCRWGKTTIMRLLERRIFYSSIILLFATASYSACIFQPIFCVAQSS